MKLTQVWIDYVFELRRNGYWGPTKHLKGFFKGFFSEEIKSIAKTGSVNEDDYTHHLSHCCDNMPVEPNGRSWNQWTEEDRKKAESEKEFLYSLRDYSESHPRLLIPER